MNFEILNILSRLIYFIALTCIMAAILDSYRLFFEEQRLSLKSKIFFAVTIILLVVSSTVTTKKYEILQENVKSGYIVSLEGNEVDANMVDFRQYIISISDKKQIIYLTHRNNRSRFVPVVVPR